MDRARLRAAIRTHQAHTIQARLLATTEQYELLDLARLTANGPPPLPADAPWVGRYRTSFESLFAGRVAPTGMRRIDKTLPHFLQLIDGRAEAVVAATDALIVTTKAYEGSAANLNDVFESQKTLRQSRRDFLMAIRDYNQTIADYAIRSVGSGVSRDTIITMLIQPVRQSKSVLVAPKTNVRQASGERPIATVPAVVTPLSPNSSLRP